MLTFESDMLFVECIQCFTEYALLLLLPMFTFEYHMYLYKSSMCVNSALYLGNGQTVE